MPAIEPPFLFECFIYGLFGDVIVSLVCMILCKISKKLIGEAVVENGGVLIDGPFPELPGGTEKNYEFPQAVSPVSWPKSECCAYRTKVRLFSHFVLPQARYKHVYFLSSDT